MSTTKKLSDGWHTVAGYRVYIEDGFVIIPDIGGSLYYRHNKDGMINLLPCKPERIRYYARVGNLHWHKR